MFLGNSITMNIYKIPITNVMLRSGILRITTQCDKVHIIHWYLEGINFFSPNFFDCLTESICSILTFNYYPIGTNYTQS